MNDERNPESPIVPEQTPDHGPDFWSHLDSTLEAEASPRTSAQPIAAGGAPSPNATTQMPRLATTDGRAAGAPQVPRSRRLWPAAAAAAVVVVLGLGFVVARGSSDPATTTEIVAAPSTVESAPAADGTGGSSGESQGDVDDVATPAFTDGEADGDTGETAPAETDTETETGADTETGSETETGTGTGQGSDEDETAATVAPIPDFGSARGAVGEPEYLPLDQGIPAHGTYLANWPERGLTWFAVSDPDATCADPGYSEIRYVNGSGFTQPVRDLQPRFSGDISHFVVSDEQNIVAWAVACGQQLELYIATLEPTDRLGTPKLVWLGEGSTSAALVLLTQGAVSLNAIEPDGALFSVLYNIETGSLSRNDGPSRIMLEAGAPASRSLTPLAASPDGGLTYWQGTAPAGTLSECAELFGSGRSDMVWLRQGEGQWQPAVPDDFPVGSITAAALDSASLQFAFADRCPNDPGRVVIGTQFPDGRIGDLITLDLKPFVSGFAAELFWIDDLTLRIETDNTQSGIGTLRFDYRLDQQVLVELD